MVSTQSKKMVEIFTKSVWAALFLVFVMCLAFGGVMSYSAWQNEIKDIYDFSQTQVEIVGSVMIIGAASGILGGLLLEHCGVRKTGCVALSTTLSHIATLVTLYHPENFNGKLFPVLVMLFLLTGVGVVINYMASMTVFLQNFTTQYGGRLTIAAALGVMLSTFFFSTGLLDVKRLIILWSCLQTLASFCCIFLLKQRLPDGASSTSGSQESSNENEDAARDKKNLTNELEETQFKGDTNSEPANEKTRLTESESKSANQKDDSKFMTDFPLYGRVYYWEIIKLPDFWLLMATFIIGSALTRLFMSNFGTYLRSFKQEEHLHIIMSTAPWFLLFVKIFVGFISDLYREKIPRLIFLVAVAIINAPIYCAFIFVADNIVFMYIVAYVSFISNGIYFLIGPVLIAEYFSVKYFGIIYGGAYLADGCFTLLLQFILGLLYDMNVTDVAKRTCYGLHCYYVSSGILFALSIVTLCACITLYTRRNR